MKLALKIEWTFEANNQLDNIIAYLEANWTDKEIKNFFIKLEKGLKTISEKPLQQKKSLRKKGTYEYQVLPQTTILYNFDKEFVTVMVLWSNKMNQEKLK